MGPPACDFPAPEAGLLLHLRLCDGEADAPADVCAAYLTPLLDYFSRAFPHEDPHRVADAVHRALMDYVREPLRFDPGRGDLAAYLRMACRGDLLNLRAREARHHRGRVGWESVELGEPGGNCPGREEEPSRQLERAEEAAEADGILRRLTAGWGEAERRLLELILGGERRTEAFAAVIGLGGAAREEQEREVKRAKDRVKRRLARWGESHA